MSEQPIKFDRCERCGARRPAYSAEPMPRCENGMTHQMVPDRTGDA